MILSEAVSEAVADLSRPADMPARVLRAVQRARMAQRRWRHFPFDARVTALRRAAAEMVRRRAEVIDLAHAEIGKVRVEALFNEALGPLDAVAGWAPIVRAATRGRTVRLNPVAFPGKKAFVEWCPRGVVGVIAPWNYPVAGLYRSVLPALLSGNAVVLKPSEHSPRTSAWFAARLAEALPDDLVQVLPGDGAAGAALIDAGVDACVFTGSPATGRLVRERCAARGIPASIEMGGKDAAVVLADCDLPRTVAGITNWALGNAGQACGAIEIAYVESGIADAFVERLRRAWTRLTPASVGPLANRRQFEVVAAQVEDAKAKGAHVVCGGEPPASGLWYPPTLLDHCHESMAVMQDETFGPVLAVARTGGASEAIRRINLGRYGLGASIWTRDEARARRLAQGIDVGVVGVNDHAFTGAIPSLPWSGTRDTGLGIANGPESLGTFGRPRVVAVDSWRLPELYWMPYDETLAAIGEALADAQVGKIGAALRVPFWMVQRLRTLRAFFQ